LCINILDVICFNIQNCQVLLVVSVLAVVVVVVVVEEDQVVIVVDDQFVEVTKMEKFK
jgi:hypothetical protein